MNFRLSQQSPLRQAIIVGVAVTVTVLLVAGLAAAGTTPQAAPPLACSGAIDPVLGGRVDCKPWTPQPAHTTGGYAAPTPSATASPTPAPSTTTPKPSPTSPQPTTTLSTTSNPPPSPKPSSGKEIRAFLTGYSYFDNTPPGSSEISNPVKHSVAAGTGTYADPITVAVGHTLSGGKDLLDWPEGTLFFFPSLGAHGLYGIVEDTCGDGSHPQDGPCHTGYPSNASTWLDIWVDGQSAGRSASDQCMSDITKVVTAVVLPKGAADPGWLPAGYVPGPISSAAGCQR